MSVRVAHISDLHVSPERPFFNANMERLFAHLRGERPDILLNTGDLGLFGERDNGDLGCALAQHRELGVECRIVPGNHDVGEHPDIAGADQVNDERLARYRRVVGPDFWVLDLPGWRLVGIDALIAGTMLSGWAEQAEGLRRAAEGRAGRSLALVLHKPLADERYDDEALSPRFSSPGARRAILDALGPHCPALVLCGHVHQYRDAAIGGSRHIWAPPASFVIGDPWQPSYGGKAVGYLDHVFHADGSHEARLRTVRGLVHNDLATLPQVYGDVTARGPGNG
ncbi:metallophosphoesterase [Alsobacter sp. SYSU M60028]|uniref:Metallophosphoesterase n=1 Tax=Alsobacter ponti TaxID=2962936 RepID=A0ABT1LFQ5_9HYPH|nr:metallophosphoesterase [Alsobacter ponti]